MKMNISTMQSTCMEVSVSLSCLLVHELPYQTTVVCYNSVFRCGSFASTTVLFCTLECGLLRLIRIVILIKRMGLQHG